MPVILGVVLIGLFVLVLVRAIAAPAAFEAEGGALSGPARVVASTGASGGQAVQFGAATPAPTPTPTPSPGAFIHPGIYVSRAQLDLVKAKIAAGAQPWTTAFNTTKANPLASPTYTPHPWAVVECGSFNNPDNGCTDEVNDAKAAYTQALLWYYTGQPAYAQKAIQIMNAWSATVTGHTNSNAPLQSAWVAEMFPRAAEIIRYTYTGWSAADVNRFATMLKSVYLPEVVNGDNHSNGNWELSMADAVMDIGVFTDDRTTFNKGLALWRGRVPAYLYNAATDGATPHAPIGSKYTTRSLLDCFWSNNNTQCKTTQLAYQDGQTQETCRDLHHASLGFASMVYAAETTRDQNINLYGEQQARIVKGLEYNAKFLNGAAQPSALCYGAKLNTVNYETYEVAYNEYANHRGLSLPQTLAAITRNRPSGTDQNMAWETLSHAGTFGP